MVLALLTLETNSLVETSASPSENGNGVHQPKLLEVDQHGHFEMSFKQSKLSELLYFVHILLLTGQGLVISEQN